MKTKNLSFDEMLKLVERLPYFYKNHFLKNLLEYEIDNGCFRKNMYFTIYNDGWTWGIDPLFESSEQVKKYAETGELIL